MKLSQDITLWKALLLAIGAAAMASLPIMCNGCSVAVQGQLQSSAAVYGKDAPPLPDWATTQPNE